MFYVYILARPNRKPFYVGKGKGIRVFTHEDEARRGCECPKCQVIRAIWKRGREVQKYIVYTTPDETDALRYEAELISGIGRHRLTNQVDGGGGARNKSPLVRAKIAATKARRRTEREERRTKERLQQQARYEAHVARIQAERAAKLEAYNKQQEEIRQLVTQGELRWLIGSFIDRMNETRIGRGLPVLTPPMIAANAGMSETYLLSLINGTAKALRPLECGKLLRSLGAKIPDLIGYILPVSSRADD